MEVKLNMHEAFSAVTIAEMAKFYETKFVYQPCSESKM